MNGALSQTSLESNLGYSLEPGTKPTPVPALKTTGVALAASILGRLRWLEGRVVVSEDLRIMGAS